VYGIEEMCIQGFGRETREKETTWMIWGKWEDNIKVNLQEA